MENKKSSLLLVGCGKMGSALLSRWRSNYDCRVIEPHNIAAENTKFYTDLASLPKNFTPDAIIFAIKPQQLDEILPQYRDRFASNPLYISIAAGKTLSFYKKHLGDNAKIVRAMPNTPAAVGAGMTALCADSSLPASSRTMAEKLMQAVGATCWLPDEKMMHGVTALSGSGPAYIFLFVDALKKAGVAAGLSEEEALTFAAHTFYGAAELARHTASPNFEQLRKNVTSPGGTTEAALKVLMANDALENLVTNAVLAAKKRSEELS